jgi:hypothetical protein
MVLTYLWRCEAYLPRRALVRGFMRGVDPCAHPGLSRAWLGPCGGMGWLERNLESGESPSVHGGGECFENRQVSST